jgi:transposase-like protein
MNDNEQPTEGQGQAAKQAKKKPAYKRREFTDAFKRKIVAEAARTSYPAVMAKYKLFSAVYDWKNEVGSTKSGAVKPSAKPKEQLGPTKEAIVYLKHAEKAFGEGKQKRGQHLAGLALSTLLGE